MTKRIFKVNGWKILAENENAANYSYEEFIDVLNGKKKGVIVWDEEMLKFAENYIKKNKKNGTND